MIRSGRRLLSCSLPLLLLLAPFRTPARGASTAAYLSPAPAALADSIAGRYDAGWTVVTAAAESLVTLPIGSTGGIRNWSVVTLSGGSTPPWRGRVKELEAARVVLVVDPDRGMTPLPPPGERRRFRIDIRRVALTPIRGASVHVAFRASIEAHLAAELADHHGFDIVRVPDFPDSIEGGEVAGRSGADLLVTPRIDRTGTKSLSLTVQVREVRKGSEWSVTVPLPPLDTIKAVDQPAPAPLGDDLPGVRQAFVSDWRAGPLLELFTRRWIWSDAQAVFDDRIETWHIGATGLDMLNRYDLDAIWPRVVPTRWPVAVITPVNTFYKLSGGDEARVNYALCSNQRSRYLTLNVEKAKPETLLMVVPDDKGDSLTAAVDSCFPKLDRVSRPEGFPLPPKFSATAVARLSLETIVRDAAGKVMRTKLGTVQTRKSAVVYYDAPSAAIWLSTAAGCSRLDGRFGSEMDEFRPGQSGPSGVLLTGAGAPGEPDHLEWWALTGDHLVRRWSSPVLAGSITALLAGDRDGDERDDLLVGEVVRTGSGWQSRLFSFSSRPAGAVAP